MEGAFDLPKPRPRNTGEAGLLQQLQAVQHIGRLAQPLRLRQKGRGQGDARKGIHGSYRQVQVKYKSRASKLVLGYNKNTGEHIYKCKTI
jgi:hypothetical protein